MSNTNAQKIVSDVVNLSNLSSLSNLCNYKEHSYLDTNNLNDLHIIYTTNMIKLYLHKLHITTLSKLNLKIDILTSFKKKIIDCFEILERDIDDEIKKIENVIESQISNDFMSLIQNEIHLSGIK